MILIVGGAKDLQLHALCKQLDLKKLDYNFIAQDRTPRNTIHWSLQNNEIYLNGNFIQPKALFVRYNTDLKLEKLSNENEKTQQSASWYAFMIGYAASHPNLRVLNRRSLWTAVPKLYQLIAARDYGLKTPNTIVSNDANQLQKLDLKNWIAKPVGGGIYTSSLDDALSQSLKKNEDLPCPATIQNKLAYPEIRVFLIGKKAICFKIMSDNLDHRTARGNTIQKIDFDPIIIDKLKLLSDHFGLDYSATDLKLDPETGDWVYLETNSMPMFAGFDIHANSEIANSIIDWLTTDQIPH